MTYFAMAVSVAIASLTFGPAAAQDTGERTIDQYLCKDIMRAADRDTSIAFLHGYLLGRSNSPTYNVERLMQQTDTFIDRCLDNPAEKAMDAMAEAVNPK